MWGAERIAAATGLAALVLYLCCVAPELTPRAGLDHDFAFQVTDPAWLQQALVTTGTAESWSPSGMLARSWALLPASWNLNWLSASLAAGAVALLTMLVWNAAGRTAAVAAGLGFGLSPATWATAVAAEGSTSTFLLAVLLLLTMWCLARWRRTGGEVPLIVASGAALLAVAEDGAFALLVPVVFAAALWRTRNFRRVLLTIIAAALVAGCVSQWLTLGTLPGRPLSGIVGLSETWSSTWRWGAPADATVFEVARWRALALIDTVTKNVGLLGWALAAFGLRGSAPFLAFSTALCLAVCVGMAPAPWDAAVRAVLLLAWFWALIGLGVSRLASWAPAGGRPVALALCALLPLLQFARLGAQHTTLVDRAAGQLLQAFNVQYPEAAAYVPENARSGRLVSWLNQRRPLGARLSVVPHDSTLVAGLIDAGVVVFVTEASAARLSLSGFSGPAAPIVGRSLESLLQSSDPRSLLAVAASPGALDDTQPGAVRAVARLVADTSPAAVPTTHGVALLARRSQNSAFVVTDALGVDISTESDANAAIPPALRPGEPIRLRANTDGARLTIEEREIGQVASGMVMAAWSPVDGAMSRSVIDTRTGALWLHDHWSFSHLGAPRACVAVDGAAWSEVTAVAAAVRLGVQLPADTRLRLYMARDRGLFVRGAAFPGRLVPAADVAQWDRADPAAARAASDALTADGIEPAPQGRYLWRVIIGASPKDAALIALGLGGAPDWARAKLEGADAAGQATLCPGVAGARLFARADLREDSISLADSDSFGDGWLPITRSGSQRWRQTSAADSELFVRVDQPQQMVISLSLRESAPGVFQQQRVRVAVNGRRLEAQDLRSDESVYSWNVPQDDWHVGSNRIVVSGEAVSGAAGSTGPPALHVTAIRFRRH